MTPEKLEEIVSELFPTKFNQTKPFVADHPNDLDLPTLRDDQIFALLAWEFWKDGMDWELGISNIAEGKSALYPTRASAIHILKVVFDY